MTQSSNIDILALSSQVSIFAEHIQLSGQASFAVVYIVSPFPEHCVYGLLVCSLNFKKLFSSCMLLNKLGLFDRVTQASLVRVLTSYDRSVHLLMADSTLAAESRSTPLNNQSPSCLLCLPFPHRFSSPCCVDSPDCSAILILSLEQEWLAT